jgi:hypothetical protein
LRAALPHPEYGGVADRERQFAGGVELEFLDGMAGRRFDPDTQRSGGHFNPESAALHVARARNRNPAENRRRYLKSECAIIGDRGTEGHPDGVRTERSQSDFGWNFGGKRSRGESFQGVTARKVHSDTDIVVQVVNPRRVVNPPLRPSGTPDGGRDAIPAAGYPALQHPV